MDALLLLLHGIDQDICHRIPVIAERVCTGVVRIGIGICTDRIRCDYLSAFRAPGELAYFANTTEITPSMPVDHIAEPELPIYKLPFRILVHRIGIP